MTSGVPFFRRMRQMRRRLATTGATVVRQTRRGLVYFLSHPWTEPFVTSKAFSRPFAVSKAFSRSLVASKALSHPLAASKALAHPLVASKALSRRGQYFLSQPWAEPLIGALVLLVLGLLLADFWGRDAVSRQAAGRHVFYAEFPNVEGLNQGAPVYMAGVRIGGVGVPELVPGDLKVNIALHTDPAFPIPDDSEIAIRTQGFFSEKHLEIIPGVSETYLVSGDQFDFSTGSLDLFRLLDTVLSWSEAKRAAEAEASSDLPADPPARPSDDARKGR